MNKRNLTFILFALLIPVITKAQNLVNAELTFETVDTLFKKPYIDVDEWRNTPVRYRYVHGGFEGTQTRFSFYFPPEGKQTNCQDN